MYRRYEHGTTRYPGHRLVFRGYPAELTVVEVASLPASTQARTRVWATAAEARRALGLRSSWRPPRQSALPPRPGMALAEQGLTDTHVVVTVACDREESATDSPLPPRAGPGT